MDAADREISFTGRRWESAERLTETGGDGSLPGWLLSILRRRGVEGDEAVRQYLSPSLTTLNDPLELKDMRAGVERLVLAITGGEPITVYGDFDVDGVCSTVVLVDFLRRVGGRVSYYIPDRRSEGYGLNAAAIRDLCPGAAVLITTDCGISAVTEVGIARDLGTDVIIVDHHQAPPELPPALACIDPQRPDCDSPFEDLCATGVAFMVTGALRRALREAGAFDTRPEPDLRELLDLVALATVADMVPIRGANRILVAAGLQRMAHTRHVGLRALLEVSRVDPSRVTAVDLGFRLAPRINARGRISHAAEAVELLLTDDPRAARELAGIMDAANRERRAIEKATVAAAMSQIETFGEAVGPALVLADPGWHPGVVGLVATRLAQRFGRPAVVIGEGGKGSARSIEGLNLFAALTAASSQLERYGGHHAAAGLTVLPEKVDRFRVELNAEVQRVMGDPPYVSVLRPEFEVPVDGLSMTMVEQIDRLAPFGQQNSEPLFVSLDVPVRAKRSVGDGHLKLNLGGHDAIAFGFGRLLNEIGARVDVAYRLERNEYNGRVSLQLRVEDLRAA